MKKKFIKRVLSVILISCLAFGSTISVGAQTDENSIESGKIESYMLITDVETGEVSKVELATPETTVVQNDKNGIMIESVITTDDIVDRIQTRDTQSASKPAQYGWKGTVKITYFDNGTKASLTAVNASWKKVSGSYTMTGKTVNYGQVLGTNSKKGSKAFSGNSVTVYPHFVHGKYGVIANLN